MQQRPHFDESLWVKRIQQSIDNDLDEDSKIPVTIFAVPKILMATDPDSYIPQQVAIGPYHHLRAELYDMERYKVAAAKRNQEELDNVKLRHLADHLMKMELRIKASYHRPLGIRVETLAWMMAVDVSFLFEFMQVCAVKEGKLITRNPSRMDYLINLERRKTAHNAILRDIVMLENQIPLFVMRKLLELQFSSLEMADERLHTMLAAFCKDLSPFQMAESCQRVVVSDCAHLLEFLYNYVVPSTDREKLASIEIDVAEKDGKGAEDGDEEMVETTHVKQLRVVVWRVIYTSVRKPAHFVKRVILSKPMILAVKLPWKVISKIPLMKTLTQPIESMFSDYGDKKDDGEGGYDDDKPPRQEEIVIPSVTQLLDAGVNFVPTEKGISGFSFDSKTLTLTIPVVKLDLNSEVVLRNLVAYEACVKSGPMVMARYTELMNGIVDTEADAAVLCRKGIIVNHLKSEREVADLWNGMSKSIRLTRVQSLDCVIADVNKFFSDRWKVKLTKFMREYVFGSWKVLTFLAAVVMVALMCLQAFCQVYSCHRILRIKALEPDGTE
ncbi:hypothetical protein SASPL_110281 [Salvia splendens]|uniref:Uncharacterized protein n=1 Tax=Salvia splendens TaxID=180675 RepID=A0A8X8Y8K6_SALSN|nr:putative UPF0481 protein At3g02645 [Salvia splendens]KAG6426067.1 hypothetical protein SASPL_110281 [Salvia splendens]